MKEVKFEGEHLQSSELPRPAGWRILVGMVKVETKTDSGIVLMESTKKDMEYLRSVGKVLAVGPDAYKHEKFQGGISLEQREPKPWAVVGDTVVVGQYSGQTIHVVGEDGDIQKLRFFNDDEVIGVIDDVSVLSL
jgi:co-chaperonin GroES (HSP10)